MSLWRVEATIMPKAGVNDPQGEAIRGSLTSLEFGGVRDVQAGKVVAIILEAESEQDAGDAGDRMCQQLLANPVIESYSITVAAETTKENKVT